MTTTERTTHTPGPWEVMKPLGPGDYGVLSEHVNAGGNFYVATIPNGQHEEALANAALIAAAPDLLAELKNLADAVAEHSAVTGDGTWMPLVRGARAAIARAEGR